jgi:hypothetical protein
MAMRRLLLLAILCAFSARAVAQEQERHTKSADNVLFRMPCHVWTELDSDQDNQVVVERRTVEFIREYARESAEVWKKQAPLPKNADGADVDDRQIIRWVTGWCAKTPNGPLAEAALLLWGAFVLTTDHHTLPPP